MAITAMSKFGMGGRLEENAHVLPHLAVNRRAAEWGSDHAAANAKTASGVDGG